MNTTIDSETVKENAERAGRAPLTAFGEVVEVLVALLRDVDRAVMDYRHDTTELRAAHERAVRGLTRAQRSPAVELWAVDWVGVDDGMPRRVTRVYATDCTDAVMQFRHV